MALGNYNSAVDEYSKDSTICDTNDFRVEHFNDSGEETRNEDSSYQKMVTPYSKRHKKSSLNITC